MKSFTRFACKSAVFATLGCVSLGVASAEDATLKLRLVYDGDAPKVANIEPNKDIAFCGKHDIPNERLIVNQENNGIQNAVVYVYTRSSGDDLPEVAPAAKTHELANVQCRFEPHVVLAQIGDTLKITNPDEVGHNANLNFFRNTAQNLMIPSKQEKEVALEEAEPAPIPVDCNIHPWMRAYVVVLEHGFADVSDGDGTIEISGLPAGKEITFAVRHEAGKIDEVTIAGKEVDWKRQRFEVDLKAGVNDLGDVMVPAKALSVD